MAIDIGAVSLWDKYKNAMDVLHRVRERLYSPENSISPELSTSPRNDIALLQSLGSEMESLFYTIAAESEREFWRNKIKYLFNEASSLSKTLEKKSLRSRRPFLNARRSLNGESSHEQMFFDEEAQAMVSVENSSRMNGEAVLFTDSNQREFLKMAQRKMFDVLNTVGLSKSALRRDQVDKWIKYFGIIFAVLLVVFFLWKCIR